MNSTIVTPECATHRHKQHCFFVVHFAWNHSLHWLQRHLYVMKLDGILFFVCKFLGASFSKLDIAVVDDKVHDDAREEVLLL